MQNQILTTNNKPLNSSPKKCYAFKGQMYDQQITTSPGKTELLLNSRTQEQINLSLSVSQRGQVSDNKRAAKSKSQEDLMLTVSAEKSYNDASQKIWRIKQMELENKVNLLTIENERLNNFLQTQIQETERLADELYNTQGQIDLNQDTYADRLNLLLQENQKLEQVNERQQEQFEFALRKQQQNHEDQLKQFTRLQLEPLTDKIMRMENTQEQLQNQLMSVTAHNDQLSNQLNILLDENQQLSLIFKQQEKQKEQISQLLKESQEQHQQTVEGFEREVKEQGLQYEELKRRNINEVKKVRQDTLNEINEQITELCNEITVKEQQIRGLQQEIENLKKMTEYQHQRELHNYEKTKQQLIKDKQALEQDREVLLNEIKEQQEQTSKLEANILRQTKNLCQREQQIKQVQNELVSLQGEVMKAKQDFKKEIDVRISEINSLKSQIDILKSENQTLKEQVHVGEREVEMVKAKISSKEIEFQQKLSVVVANVNASRDQQLEQSYKEQQEVLNKEQRQREVLERKIQEQNSQKRNLEMQIEQMKAADSLADAKIQELLKLNGLLDRDILKYREEAQKSSLEEKSARRKLELIESAYEMEKESFREQVLQTTDEIQKAFLEKDTALQQKRDTQIKFEALRNEYNTLKATHDRMLSEDQNLKEKLSKIEKDNAKHLDLVHSQRLELENHRLEMKQTVDSYGKNFEEREQELLNKISEQQSFIEELTSKYNELLKKAKKYRSHVKVLRESAYRPGAGQSEFGSTKRTIFDNVDYIYEDENDIPNQPMKVIDREYSVDRMAKPFSSMGRPPSRQ